MANGRLHQHISSACVYIYITRLLRICQYKCAHKHISSITRRKPCGYRINEDIDIFWHENNLCRRNKRSITDRIYTQQVKKPPRTPEGIRPSRSGLIISLISRHTCGCNADTRVGRIGSRAIPTTVLCAQKIITHSLSQETATYCYQIISRVHICTMLAVIRIPSCSKCIDNTNDARLC